MRTGLRTAAIGLTTIAMLAGGGVSAANAGSGWQPTGSMSDGRSAHAAALLNDRRVLAISGFDGAGQVATAELYSPASGEWSLAAQPLVPRRYATATTLPDGKVLLSGGVTVSGTTNHAELYDPAANTWTVTGAMAEPRTGHSTVLLDNGRVLVTGGATGLQSASATSELYDPATGTWSPAGLMLVGRENHQATKLADGRVLVTGGNTRNPSLTFFASSQIYDPTDNSWASAASMAVARSQMTGGLLPDGTVLTANGVNDGFVTAAERFDPATGTWSPAGSTGIIGSFSSGVTLRDGRFLLTTEAATTTPLYDPAVPASGAWSSAYASSVTRGMPSITRLADGRVLLAGGSGSGGSRRASAELFVPPTERGASGGAFPVVQPGDRDERDVTLANDGGNPLWIDGIALAGADVAAFSVVGDECTDATLQPAETCVVRVRFSPPAVGRYSAELTVDDNAETSPAVELSGNSWKEGTFRPDPPADVPPPVLPDPRVGPPPPLPVPPGPPSCSQPYVALVGITATGGTAKPRARLTGLATPSLAGSTVTVLRGTRKVGSARVAADGRIAVSVPAPKQARARAIARYRLSIPGSVRSAALKATRRVGSARKATLADGGVRITGRVAGVRRPTTLQVRSAPVCGPKVRGVRVRTDSRGRFRVTLSAPPTGVPAVVHRVWLQNRSVTLPIVATAKR